MGLLLYKIVDTVILLLCLPFYAVVVPLIVAHQAIAIRTREVRMGQEIRRCTKPDVQEKLRVVDVSRLRDGLVGVQRCRWNVLYGESEPAFPDLVEFCTVGDFWFGSSRLFWLIGGATPSLHTAKKFHPNPPRRTASPLTSDKTPSLDAAIHASDKTADQPVQVPGLSEPPTVSTAQLTDFTAQLANSTAQLVDLTAQLTDSTAQLVDFTAQLADPTTQLADPTTQLADPTTQLADPTTQSADPTKQLATLIIVCMLATTRGERKTARPRWRVERGTRRRCQPPRRNLTDERR